MKPISESTLRGMTKNAMYNVIRKKEQEWNELKEYIEDKLEYANTYITNQNCKPQGDLGMQYFKAEIDKWRLEKVLSKIEELESRK